MPFALAVFVKYAYLILFVWVLVEQVGVPIPSIPVLLTAGTLSATHRLSASMGLLCVLAACMLSDSMWYLLGRRFGNKVLKLLCRFSLEASTCVTKTEDYFVRRGPVTLLFAKFVPGLSTVAAPIAGQTNMPFARFLLWGSGWLYHLGRSLPARRPILRRRCSEECGFLPSSWSFCRCSVHLDGGGALRLSPGKTAALYRGGPLHAARA